MNRQVTRDFDGESTQNTPGDVLDKLRGGESIEIPAAADGVVAGFAGMDGAQTDDGQELSGPQGPNGNIRGYASRTQKSAVAALLAAQNDGVAIHGEPETLSELDYGFPGGAHAPGARCDFEYTDEGTTRMTAEYLPRFDDRDCPPGWDLVTAERVVGENAELQGYHQAQRESHIELADIQRGDINDIVTLLYDQWDHFEMTPDDVKAARDDPHPAGVATIEPREAACRADISQESIRQSEDFHQRRKAAHQEVAVEQADLSPADLREIHETAVDIQASQPGTYSLKAIVDALAQEVARGRSLYQATWDVKEEFASITPVQDVRAPWEYDGYDPRVTIQGEVIKTWSPKDKQHQSFVIDDGTSQITVGWWRSSMKEPREPERSQQTRGRAWADPAQDDMPNPNSSWTPFSSGVVHEGDIVKVQSA